MAACNSSAPWRLSPPYPFVTGDLYFLPKIWSKSLVLGTDPFEDALKRPITTIPPSITTTHHDGGLPSPLSYTLADDEPPLPSTVPKRLRRNLRERNIFRKDGWTKWEAVKLTDELEAERDMMKADWECWKKIEERFERIHRPFLFDSDQDDKDEAHRDKRIQQRRNVDPLQHIIKVDMLLYSPYLPPTAWVSRTKNSAQRNWRKTRRKKAGKFISCTMGSGEKSFKEVAENACARPHSGISLSVIDEVDAKVDNDSM